MAEDALRIDLFLWFVRIAKTRDRAQALATDGHLRLDGRPVSRASTLVRVGSVITFALNGKVRAVRVEALPKRRGPAPEAALCVTDLIRTVDDSAAAT